MDLLRTKHAVRFAMLDATGDGLIRQRDFQGLAERLVRRFVLDPRSRGAVRAAYDTAWLQVLAACGDRVTEDVFVSARLGARVGAADAVAVRVCGGVVDGTVAVGQVAEVVVALGAHPGDTAVIGEALEPDGTLLPLAAVTGRIARYFTDREPSGLYGRLTARR